ncbi:outer membrane protein assembly factor BamA [Rhodohalobacter sp. 614A]|uniref:outer membrane protein assembly factor BamA n=1 Tax=Rhodohalobacter sp. 614A TaxID=2908649 RepID=UPI001F299F5E
MFNSKHFFFLLLLLISISFIPRQSSAQESDSTAFEIQDPTTITTREYEIREINISGLVTARETYLLSSSGLDVGDTIQIPGDDIASAIRQIYRTGIFSDVQITYEPVGVNEAIINIVVEEEPRLQSYELRGIKRSQRRDLREQLNLLRGFAVTNSIREQALITIRRFYREKGYWGTDIEIYEEISDDERNRLTLVFDIDPGDRTKVREFNFEGNEEFSDRKLRKEFDTIKQDRWWRLFKRHVYTQEKYQEGIDNILQFYRNNGYRDVRVLEDSVYVDDWRRKEGVYFDIQIQEGPQYHIRNIEWEGNTVYTDEELTNFLEFEKGDVFNETKFNENVEYNRSETDITSLYNNIGYLFFQIYPNMEIVQGDSLDVTFEIIEDEIATIRRVSFSGNTKTHDDVVRRTLRTVPGNTYSRSAIVRSIRELGTLGYFSPEGISPNINPNREEGTVDISYELDESQGTDNFEFSGGFGGRQIGIILSARVNFNNFSIGRVFEPGGWSPIPSGDGQKLSLGVQVTGRGYQSYSFSFTEPWLKGRPTSLGVSMSYNFYNYSNTYYGSLSQVADRRNELFTTSVSLGKQLDWPDDYFSQRLILTYNRFNVRNFSGIFEDGRADILTLRGVLSRNSLNNPISPSAGSEFDLSAEFALPIPGFAQFYKIKTGYQHHYTIVDKLVLSGSVDYGYMGYFSDNKRSNFQRFYLGGTQIQQRQNFLNDNIDLRGYPGGQDGVISPVDENQFQVGGRVFNKYSMELRYPAVSSDQVQLIPYVFMDAGNAFNTLKEFDPFEVKRAVGFGARIFLPILGLVDLSYGYRLDGTEPSFYNQSGLQAGEWEFLFNIGTPF